MGLTGGPILFNALIAVPSASGNRFSASAAVAPRAGLTGERFGRLGPQWVERHISDVTGRLAVAPPPVKCIGNPAPVSGWSWGIASARVDVVRVHSRSRACRKRR